MRPIFLMLMLLGAPVEGASIPAVAAPSPIEAPRPVPELQCTTGSKVKGAVDQWSPLSTCPDGYIVTGLSRIDLLGDHNSPIIHVNDFVCDDSGCKAWCIGSGCLVVARCCRIKN